MKVQMSLEMLAYISIAGISLLYSARAMGTFYSGANQSVIGYEYSAFSQQINTAILGNYTSVNAYVPYGFCPNGINGSEISTKYGKIYFVSDVRETGSVLCGPGQERVNITYHYGYAQVW